MNSLFPQKPANVSALSSSDGAETTPPLLPSKDDSLFSQLTANPLFTGVYAPLHPS